MYKLYRLLAFGTIIAPLAGTPAFAQCPPGTKLVPAGRDGAGNAVAAYCAAAPTVGTNDPYTGRNAPDPQATPSERYVPPSR